MNVLQIDKKSPYPPSSGAEKRVWRTAERLSKLGEVWLAAPDCGSGSVPAPVEFVPIRSRMMTRKFVSNDLWYGGFVVGERNPVQWMQTTVITRSLTALDVKFDVVVSEAPQMIPPARTMAEKHNAKLLINKHNSYFDLLDQYLVQSAFPDPLRQRAVKNLKRYEQQSINVADIVVFQSEDDQKSFEIPQDTVTMVIPNGTDYEEIQSGGDPDDLAGKLGISTNSFVCLFIGSYDYEPNTAAAETIIYDLAPQLREMEFVLVGRNPPPTSQPNVHTTGYVEQLSDALELADIGLCPIPRGSGTKLKMLDYMAAGLPIVTTSVGAQGLPIAGGKHALVCDDAAAMITAITEVADSPELRSRLSTNAYALSQQYAWSTLMDGYDRLFEVELLQLE
ncbi:glycosyltransferase family 4 protein [Natrononativus amylolyticus]|uniref:glycosyltransferase family 4 protein n=1 Tax=Natrononativus amylolyticus TaxID=2963434 RepID=UPI0020CE4F21|nr:glycosyltransferase family 4 protein [Natrononativus amylolyticus]